MDYRNEINATNEDGGRSGGFVRRNANTNAFTFFNGDKMLSMSFYNDFLSISIADKTVDENGRAHYTPKNERVNRLFSRENIITLLAAVDTYLVPAMIDYCNSSRGGFDDKAVLDLSKKSCCVMAQSRDEVTIVDIHVTINDKNEVKSELRLHFGINSERIAKESKVYEFAKSTLITNYDPASGQCDTMEYPSQFMLFKKLLERFIDAGTHAVSHDIQQALGWQMDNIRNNVNAIAEKNGISTGRRYNNTYQPESPFKDIYKEDPAPQDAMPMKESGSISDLLISGDEAPF